MAEYDSEHDADYVRRHGRGQPSQPPRRTQPPYDLSPRSQQFWRPEPQRPAQPQSRHGAPPPPPPPPRKPPRRHRPPHPVLALRALLCAASAAVLLASGATWAAYHDLASGLLTSDAINEIHSGEKGYVAPHLGNDVNLLLIGLDSRKDMDGNNLPTDFVEEQLHAGSSEIGGYNTNVLILMHIPADGGQVSAFSIARDDYVEEPGGESLVGLIPDLGMHKIKEAYGRAKGIAEGRLRNRGMTDKAEIEKLSREVGRESTIRAVQLLTGEHIDHLAEINLLGFYDIAKAVGPIEVCLNHPVYDPIEAGAGTGLRLPAGHSMLDAPTALQFVRQRFHLLRGDFDRNRRQQAFLSAVMRKLRDEGVIGDLGRMQALFGVVKKDLVIDDGWDVLDFATRAQNLTGGNAVFRELPITGQPVLPGDGSVNRVDPVRIREIVTTAFGDAPSDPSDSASSSASTSQSSSSASQAPDTNAPAAEPSDSSPTPSSSEAANADQGDALRPNTPSPPHAVIDLYNTTATRGLAATASDVLTSSGWPVDKTLSAPPQPRSTVLYGRGAAEAATQVAAKLGLAAVPMASGRAGPGRVQVYLGADYTPGVPGPGDQASEGSASAPAAQSDQAASPGIAMSNGITCVN